MYIGVSICLESRAKEDNFTGDDWEHTGHGHYLNGSAGNLLCHGRQSPADFIWFYSWRPNLAAVPAKVKPPCTDQERERAKQDAI